MAIKKREKRTNEVSKTTSLQSLELFINWVEPNTIKNTIINKNNITNQRFR